MKYNWHIHTNDAESKPIPEFFKKEQVSEHVARILMRRGIQTKEELHHFLHDRLSDLADPFLMKDMGKAVTRILAAINRKERIVIYGDYDVDGITSTSILFRYLRRIGGDVDFYIPSREGEGYGLNEKALQTLNDKGFTLLVTVDCGISSAELISQTFSKPDIIVTDHHMPPHVIPSCIAVIDPHQTDCPYPFKEMAGCGVAYSLCRALHLTKYKQDYTDDIELVALGTIADVVSLTGENRILVKEGLRRFPTTKIRGLYALLKSAGIVNEDMEKEIRADRISFGIAPRLNAAGRIAHAGEGVRLMLTESAEEARQMAERLCDRNAERQKIEKETFREALIRLEDLQEEQDLTLVIDGKGWNPGVIGIVASRILERYRRPALLITIQDGIGKGSCRSISAFNIYEALQAQSDLLIQFGGHKMAAGFSIPEKNIPEFRKRLNAYAHERITEEDCVPHLEIEESIPVKDITIDMISSLSLLEPCGCDNPKPLFALKHVFVESARHMGSDGQHFKCQLSQHHHSVEALFWNTGTDQPCKAGDTVSVAFEPEIHEWYGQHPQLICKDIRKSEEVILTRDFLTELFKKIKQILLISPKPTETVRLSLLQSEKEINRNKILLGLQVFEELGILSRYVQNGLDCYEYHILKEKADLESSSVYRAHRG